MNNNRLPSSARRKGVTFLPLPKMPLFGIVKGNWLNKRENEATCSEIFDSHLVLIYISWEMTEVKRGSYVSFNWFYAGPLFWRKWDWQTFVFKEGGKPESLKKLLGARWEPTTNTAHTCNRAETERGPHWWEASALTTGWFLFPNVYEDSSKMTFILLL